MCCFRCVGDGGINECSGAPGRVGDATGSIDNRTEVLNNVARAAMNGGAGVTPADDAAMSDHDKKLFDNVMGPSL